MGSEVSVARALATLTILAAVVLLAAALRHLVMTSSGATVSVPTAPSWSSWTEIDLQPSWTWLDRGAPDRAYDKAQLVGDRVVGPWFCLDRDTGREVWRAGEPRPNTLFRIRDGMIVATETLSRGPTTGSFGVYGFELATGRLAWTHHRDGEWRDSPERLELVAEERGWDREGPSRLIPEGVVTGGGRVLDLQTGRLLRRQGDGEPREDPDFGVLGKSLFAAGALDLPGLGRLPGRHHPDRRFPGQPGPDRGPGRAVAPGERRSGCGPAVRPHPVAGASFSVKRRSGPG